MNPHAWFLADLENVPKNGIKVMSTFSCGGGSSMGYKLAGCDVIAANDIDQEMAWHYQKNHNPKHYFLCPIRDLLAMDLPPDLFTLDILDGSPPCSTFSSVGLREKAWGKEKHFREGQAKQVLSDLFFDYLDLVAHLRPKVAIAENVKGMIIGNAKGYTKLVMQRFREIGYRPQLFLINAADCGVAQSRERVFFCAVRDDMNVNALTLNPENHWVSSFEACSDIQCLTDDEATETKPAPNDIKCWAHTRKGGKYSEYIMKAENRTSCFQHQRLDNEKPSPTLTSNGDLLTHWGECRTLTLREWVRLGSFPDDYHFRTPKIGKYMIGMSVPPKMTEQVARAVCSQWLGVDYG